MIIIKLQGGIGNQLFQWAIYKFLESKYSNECFIDTSFYNNQIGVTNRKFSIQKFPNINFKIKDQIEKKKFNHIIDNFNFQNFILNFNQNYYFDGYWQTEKYFKSLSDQIRFELSPTQEIKKKLYSIIPKINNSISLHVRRTDYLTSNGFHPIQTIEYYDKSLEIIGNYDFIYVFSDDIEWCKKNLKYKNIVFIENEDEITDIWLQSICKNNIIANSSFSWWGAWLNNNLNKKIIAPKNWFGSHTNINTKDIIPTDWLTI